MQIKKRQPTNRHIDQITQIQTYERAQLIALWHELLLHSPPKGLSQTLMRGILAYEVQALANKCMHRKYDKRLGAKYMQSEQLERCNTRNLSQRNTATSLKTGSQILREWNGVTHKIEVLDDGYRWQNKTYKSLSAIAKAITGAHWSGPRFFGLNKAGEQK